MRITSQIIVGLLVGWLQMLTGGGNAQQVLKITDVSPDNLFGTPLPPNAGAPTGRVEAIVIDPTNDSTLYAATAWAGVWKSTDAAHTWQQSGIGLRSGLTAEFNSPPLAIDALNPSRLLYVTQPLDGRIGSPYGGLWVSTNAGGSWQHIDPCTNSATNSSVRSIYSVAFAKVADLSKGFGGISQPFVAADCGILTTADPNLTTGWSPIPGATPFPNSNVGLATINTASYTNGSSTLFACQGSAVYRRVLPLSPLPSWTTINLKGGCFGIMAAVPTRSPFALGPSALVVMYNYTGKNPCGKPTQIFEVAIVDFDATTVSPLDFAEGNPHDQPATCIKSTPGGGAGPAGVFLAPYRTQAPPDVPNLPLENYDLYVADGYTFYRYNGDTPWPELSGMHGDSWSMAFASTYDPKNGNCTAYAANDGGVFANPGSVCFIDGATNGWVEASSGLHIVFSSEMTGLSQGPPSSPCQYLHPDGTPCPVLFLPSADDDTWISTYGGALWSFYSSYLGDSTETFIDPALPTLTLSMRNGLYHLSVGSNGQLPASGYPYTEIVPDHSFGGTATPAPGYISQVMTMPNESPLTTGDYVAIVSEFRNPGCTPPSCANDVITRNISATTLGQRGWSPVSSEFGPGQVGAIATSGGHSGLTIYALMSNSPHVTFPPTGAAPGQIWRGHSQGGRGSWRWDPASGMGQSAINRAYDLIANPYDPNEVWVTDLGDQTIKVTRDGGKTWQPVPVLKDIATNCSEFDFNCGASAYWPAYTNTPYADRRIFGDACSLAGVTFVRDHPEIRVAALFPGGVAFSRDKGMTWVSLNVTHNSLQPIKLPQAVFYDPQPNAKTGNTSLYIAYAGRSVERVDGPFPSLMGATVVYCPTCTGGVATAQQVVGVVGPSGTRVSLQRSPDGLFRGDLLFDSANLTALEYYFEVDGKATPHITQQLSQDEKVKGVSVVSNALPVHSRGRCP